MVRGVCRLVATEAVLELSGGAEAISRKDEMHVELAELRRVDIQATQCRLLEQQAAQERVAQLLLVVCIDEE